MCRSAPEGSAIAKGGNSKFSGMNRTISRITSFRWACATVARSGRAGGWGVTIGSHMHLLVDHVFSAMNRSFGRHFVAGRGGRAREAWGLARLVELDGISAVATASSRRP